MINFLKKYWGYVAAFFAVIILAFTFRPRTRTDSQEILRRAADALKKSTDNALKSSENAREANRKRIEAQTPEETDKEANEWLEKH